MSRLLRRHTYGVALAFVVVLTIVTLVVSPASATPSGLLAQAATFAPFALVALASTFAILSGGGGIDISIGPNAALVNCVLVAIVLPQEFWGTWYVALPLALLLGGLIGAINGLLVAVLRFQPVIASLAMYFVCTGLALTAAPRPVTVSSASWISGLASMVGPIPGPALLIGLPLLLWALLGLTPYRRMLYAVGGNEVTAYTAGTDVVAVRVVAYALGGVMAGAAGVALSALVLSSQPSTGGTFALVGLAAVALGGTSLAGGRGGLLGSLLGALAIFQLQGVLAVAGMPPTWNTLAYGVLLVVGVIVGAVLQRIGRSRKALT